jgi:protein gp37
MKDRTPRFRADRLKEPYRIKEPSLVFVANTGDLFGDWQKDEDIKKVMKVMEENPQHTFQLLTKNPKRMSEWSYPANVWCGTSIESADKLDRLKWIKRICCGFHYISFEPLLGFIGEPDLQDIGWVIIGAETEKASHIPKDERQSKIWAEPLIKYVKECKIPLFLKPNLRWHEKIQEFPK